ncbi:putative mitochondrial inner membrane translocase subunit TIM44 [Cryomyces antarcticus]
MSALSRSSISVRAGGGPARAFAAPSSNLYGRTAAYRRLSYATLDRRSPSSRQLPSSTSQGPIYPLPALRSQFLPHDFLTPSAALSARRLHLRSRLYQEASKKDDIRPPPSEGEPKAQAADFEQASAGDEAAGAKANENGEQKKEGEQADGEGETKDGDKKEAPPPPPPHGDKTPWQVFTETLKTEFSASKEWNESTKQLGGTIHDFTQNPNVQRAKSAYTKTTDAAASGAATVLKTTGKAIGQMKGVRKSVTAVGSGLEKVTRPVRETEAYKNVKNVIDDGSSSRYGGWVEKEERRKKREAREMQEAARTGRPGRPLEKMEEDPNAGTNVTLHKDAKWKETWREFKDSSPVMQRLFSLKSTYNESENPLISTARSISDRVAGFFAENETAMVIKKFREMDPSFQLEPFLTEMRDYILPEVLDAYVKGDVETLKLWLSAAQYQVYAALMQQYTTAGLKSDGRILDIRNVDILSARMLDPGEIPVFVLMCRTQEVHVYRQAKTGDLAAGMEDKVQQVTYAIGVTRIPEEVSNPETRGWRLIELQKSGRDYI